ncbi:MAG: alpha/beta fold hydrolase [Myxococcales bacterium]|nr:alpha/beta fold hydrolase [Myxococcales bacterium]
MPTIQRDHVTIFFRDNGRGLPVLLLHPFPMTSEELGPQLEGLSARYRLIAPDHRGFGKSGAGAGPTEMSTIAADALAVLDSLGIDSAVVGGVSMGGYAALALLRLAPRRVKGLVLADTQAGPDDEEGRRRRLEIASRVEASGMSPLLELVPKLLGPRVDPAVRAQVEAMIRGNQPAGAAAAQRGMAARPDSRELLSRFDGPVLIIVGELDPLTTPEKAREMAALARRARVVEIPGVGHLANYEAPEAFNRALEEFLAGIE